MFFLIDFNKKLGTIVLLYPLFIDDSGAELHAD